MISILLIQFNIFLNILSIDPYLQWIGSINLLLLSNVFLVLSQLYINSSVMYFFISVWVVFLLYTTCFLSFIPPKVFYTHHSKSLKSENKFCGGYPNEYAYNKLCHLDHFLRLDSFLFFLKSEKNDLFCLFPKIGKFQKSMKNTIFSTFVTS